MQIKTTLKPYMESHASNPGNRWISLTFMPEHLEFWTTGEEKKNRKTTLGFYLTSFGMSINKKMNNNWIGC